MSKRLAATGISPGDVIDLRYEVVKTLGVGAVGSALHVIDRELENQALVLKVLHPHLASDANTVKRFYAEAILARQLTHPNILRVYDVASSGTLHYLTMEYIEGCSLNDLLSGCSGRRLPFDEGIHVLQQVLQALVAAHEREVLHRDIKPSNILVDRVGIVKLADFGLAKSIQTSFGLTQTGELLGTPAYMAPEQFLSGGDASSDLYAWGILAFEVFCGVVPFQSESALALMHKHQKEPLPSELLLRAQIPTWCISLIEQCTAKDPAARPLNARAALARLQQEQGANVTHDAQKAVSAVVKRRQRSHYLLTDSARTMARIVWFTTILIITLATLNEKIARERIAVKFIAAEKATGLPAKPFLHLLGFGPISRFRPEDLENVIARGDPRDISVLFAGGVDPNKAVPGHLSPLHQSLQSTHSFTEGLCLRGASAEQKDLHGDTPLLAAVRRGLSIHVEVLVKYCQPDLGEKDAAGNTVFALAVSRGDIHAVNELFDLTPAELLRIQSKRNAAGLNVMHIAAHHHDLPMLDTLLKQGVEVDMRDEQGRTPLIRLMGMAPTEEAKAAAALLLKHGASVTAKDNEGLGCEEHYQRSSFPEWQSVLGMSRHDKR